MKKLKQILVIVGLGAIPSLVQATSCPETCPPGEVCSSDGNGGAGGCIPNVGAPTHSTPTNEHNNTGIKDVKSD